MPARLQAAVSAAWLLLLLCPLGASPFDEGKAAFTRQDWSAAATSLARFMADNPDSSDAPTAAFLRGVAVYQLGDYRASLDAFQKLERRWPQSAFLRRLPYWKGTAALAAGQHAVAERELALQANFPEEEPFVTRAVLNLALARVALGKREAAASDLKQFTESSREPALLAQAWATWGDLDRLAGRFEAAVKHYRSASQANPGDPWDLWSRTQALDVLIQQALFQEALSELLAAELGFAGESVRWALRRVSIARGLGDLAALRAALDVLWSSESDPKKKQELASNRARVAEESGQPEPSWWLKTSQGPVPSVGAAAIVRYAYLLENSADLEGAARALELWVDHPGVPAALKEEPLSRAALNRLATGEKARAVQLWDRLIKDFPKSQGMPQWLLERGKVRLEAGDSTRALADFARLLKDFPKATQGPEARYQTGLVYLRRQEPARAESWFFGLVDELKSGDLYQRALLARGVSFVNAGKAELARGSLQRLVRESPEGPWTGEAWLALGRNALQAGAFEEAAAAYGQAEATLADSSARAEALWSRSEALAARTVTVEAASEAYRLYAERYPEDRRRDEARYRQGAVFLVAKLWSRALEVWTPLVPALHGSARAQTREGLATVLLRLGRADEAWEELSTLETETASPEAWYRCGLVASSLGQGDWAIQAFQYLLQHHPESSVAEAALPRAAGALLTGGQSDEALLRYADYFRKLGRQPSAAPVAKAAAAGALAYPETLEALVSASRTWDLGPEVSAEFSLAWAQSRLDADSPAAQAELKALSQSAPWASQRSDALLVLGKWHRDRGRLGEARTLLESAVTLGDDLAVFKARWALAQVTEASGDLSAAARQRESTEKSAGPGVPMEFRLQILREAADTWSKAGKGDDATRVGKRIALLSP